MELPTDGPEARLLYAFGMTAGLPYKMNADTGEALLLVPVDWESRLLARLAAQAPEVPEAA
ncbi:hypothetical protein GCM10010357_29120 [Streptomyces luteireticuli]|uniref:Uncharacterized protein n=1 Tax=Streptomyces luteireticuli TaxID=173858 RepID=A0ABN0YR82_9ACTN